ncbi:MAG TPA: carboxypeptidase regulatory-like domain-containing protein [Vicinamibacterales bacterium]|nr:carboxypeptidase regulatory-like domain-containing protein [Vicinamibacterales bacterium]
MSERSCFRRATVVVFALSLLMRSLAAAQGGTTTATLSGIVSDTTGGVLPGVTVTLTDRATNHERTAVTNENGLYRFAGLAPGTYTASAELQGFAKFIQNDLNLNVGAAGDLNITLKVSTLEETMTVTGETPLIESAKTDLRGVIQHDQLQNLPTVDRNYLNYALLTPGVNYDVRTAGQGIGLKVAGARDKEGALLVDGFWNTDESFTFPKIKYSLDSLAEYQVAAIGGAAEYGRSIGGIVSAVTKSGGNHVTGSGYGYFRDTALNSQDFLSAQQGLPKAQYTKQQYGGSFGGPIRHDRTFFFSAFDRSQEDFPFNNNITQQNAAIIGLLPSDAGQIPQWLYDTFALGKVTHVVNQNNTLLLSYAFTKEDISNFNENFTTPSLKNQWFSTDNTVTFEWTRVAANGNHMHDLKVGFIPRNFDNTRRNVGGPPLTAEGDLRSNLAPSVNISNTATFGGGYILLDMFTRPVQGVYSTTMFKSNHSIKFGGDVMWTYFEYLRYQGPQSGSYTFSSIPNFLIGRYTTYSQAFGPPGLVRYHSYISAFAQDSWAVNKRLTVNYGLRWDGDGITGFEGQEYGNSWFNLGPRLSVAYDLTGKGTTVLKGGVGQYFDRLWQNPVTPTYYNNELVGPQISATWMYGQAGSPVYPNTIPGTTLPPNAPVGVRNVYIVPPNVKLPETVQGIVTLDHAVNNSLMTSVSFVGSHSWHKETLNDTNLVWPNAAQPDAVCCFARPNTSFRQILQYQYWGEAQYVGLVLSAQQRFKHGLRFQLHTTIARSLDQGENWNTQVTDPRHPEQDWGPAGDIPTVTFTGNGAYDINKSMQVSAVLTARTGLRLDPLVGPAVDVHATGLFNSRTPGLDRNSFMMPGLTTMDARFTYTLPLASARQRIQLTVEGFNLFNRGNVRTENTLYGTVAGSPNAAFGTPLTYFPPRQFQLGARISF